MALMCVTTILFPPNHFLYYLHHDARIKKGNLISLKMHLRGRTYERGNWKDTIEQAEPTALVSCQYFQCISRSIQRNKIPVMN